MPLQNGATFTSAASDDPSWRAPLLTAALKWLLLIVSNRAVIDNSFSCSRAVLCEEISPDFQGIHETLGSSPGNLQQLPESLLCLEGFVLLSLTTPQKWVSQRERHRWGLSQSAVGPLLLYITRSRRWEVMSHLLGSPSFDSHWLTLHFPI